MLRVSKRLLGSKHGAREDIFTARTVSELRRREWSE